MNPARTAAVVGAGYIQALLAQDGMEATYHEAFTDAELLAAITDPLRLMGRYIGYHVDKTPTEIGDALVRAAFAKLEGTTE